MGTKGTWQRPGEGFDQGYDRIDWSVKDEKPKEQEEPEKATEQKEVTWEARTHHQR